MYYKLKKFFLIVIIATLLISSGCSNIHEKVNNKNSKENYISQNENNTIYEPIIKNKNIAYLDNFKYKTIELPSSCNTIGSLVVSGNFVFFTGGSNKPASSSPPCLTYIEKLFSYNIKSGEITNIAQINNGFAQIDWVDANKDWIVYREINSEYGGPVRICAINRNNGHKKIVIDNDKGKCTGITSQHLYNLNLYGNFLVVPDFSLKVTKRDKNGKIKEGMIDNSISIVDLLTNKRDVIFSKSSPINMSGAIFSTSVNSSYLVFNYAEGGLQTIYLYDFNKKVLKKLLNVALESDPQGSNKNYLMSTVVLTEDNNIIYSCPADKENSDFETVIAPISDIHKVKRLFRNTPDYYLMWPRHEPKNYIAWVNRKKGLMVLNKNSETLTTIRDVGGVFDFVDDDKIVSEYSTVVHSSRGDVPAINLILINLD